MTHDFATLSSLQSVHPSSHISNSLELVGVDVVNIVANVGINTCISRLRTSVAEAHGACQNAGRRDGDRSTAVSTAGVLSGSRCAEHVVCDGRGAVLVAAGGSGYDWDGNVAQ